MEKEREEHIKIKIAICLNRLLERSKSYAQFKGENDTTGKSYNKIALNADVRKATVSDIFNARSAPISTTLIQIIEAMGFDLDDFSKIYRSLKDTDIRDFRERNKNIK